jgi:membrane protease YdiL (CAAX protease family)
MPQASKSCLSGDRPLGDDRPVGDGRIPDPGKRTKRALILQIVLVYGLIEVALWTRIGAINTVMIILATLCILWFAFRGRFTLREMGLGVPPLAGSAWIVAGGIVLAAMVPLLAAVLGENAPPRHPLPLHQAWLYAVWALQQEFVLESFFFVRMETLLGSKWAVPATALLFATAHIPNPVLVFTTLLGGVFFCEMFRRYRTILPLGLVHAMLGLIVAASFSDAVLHHMRVGIGYLRFHG